MTSLEIRDLGVVFSGREILSGLNLNVPSGSYAAILGPSGCGKTTLLRSIAGLITPASGTIRFGKQLVSVSSLVLPPHKRNIGYVPQEGGLFPHLSVGENVGFALSRELSKEVKNSIVDEMLNLVGLQGFKSRRPHQLSGGQQTRVALARALAMKPAMVLLDEPFAALDQALRSEISEEVVALLKATKTTTIMVTHDREDALVSADLIALMRSGQVVQSGTPAQVYSAPISAEVAQSTGDIVTLPAYMSEEQKILSPLHSSTTNFDPNGDLLIRPEEIHLSAASQPATKNQVKAAISKINYYGHDALIELKVEGWELPVRARVTGSIDFTLGQAVYAELQGPLRWVPRKATHQ
jgi:iron(III) transport system ATP-binding protein